MTENKEGLEPQKTPEGEGAPVTPEVAISQEELDDLKHKAEVSSQNFARLKKAEEENELLKAQLELNNTSPDPGEERVANLETTVSELNAKLSKTEVLESYPLLKGLWNELEEFRTNPDNKGMSLRTAAKAFLVEKGLLEPQRKGLEKPTGGPRVPISVGMTVEEVKKLRETNHRKYLDMVQKGEIKFSE